jgi:hypothetical protein
MKRNSLLVLSTVIAASAIFSACFTKTRLTTSEDMTEIKNVPFSGKEYKSNNEFIRIVESGESRDLQLSGEIALTNAQSKMATLLRTKLERVADAYAQNVSNESSTDFSKKFESNARVIVNQTLSDVTELEKKNFKKSNGVYQTWVVLQVSKKAALAAAMNGMSSQKLLKLESDQAKFREIFDREMSKID